MLIDQMLHRVDRPDSDHASRRLQHDTLRLPQFHATSEEKLARGEHMCVSATCDGLRKLHLQTTNILQQGELEDAFPKHQWPYSRIT
jgi:hypothetical protein